MSEDRLLVRSLVACYPPGWRRRYGEEFAAMLTDCLTATSVFRRPRLIASALTGAFDARLNVKGNAMFNRSKAPLSAAIWAAGLFTVTIIGFQKMTEDPTLNATANHHGAISGSLTVLTAAAAIALLALVLAAIPTAAAMVRRGPDRTWWWLVVPVAAFVAWYGVLRAALAIAGHHGVHSAANITAAMLVLIAGIGVVAATAWAADTVVRRVPTATPAQWRRALLTILAAGMAAATIAGLAWGLALHSADPNEFRSPNGILATPLVPSWIVNTTVMAVAAVLAAQAARHESRALQVT